MSGIDFAKRMSQVPDEELAAVVSSKGFLPKAVDAAKAELERRNVNPSDLISMRDEVTEVRRVEEDRPDVPLGIIGKIIFLLTGPALLWSVPAALILRLFGHHRKCREAFFWIVASLPFYLTLSMIGDVIVGHI